MSNTPDISAPRNPRVKWVVFQEKQAVLRRVMLPENKVGLAVVCRDDEPGRQVMKRAEENGFRPLKGRPNILIRMAGPEGFPMSIMELAEKFGGKVLDISREEMKDKTVYVGMPKPEKAPEPANAAPAEPGEVREQRPVREEIVPIRAVRIGTNSRGNEVYQAENGRFEKNEWGRMIPESSDSDRSFYLRARLKSDLPMISLSIFREVERRATMTRADIEAMIDIAMQVGPSGKAPEFTAEEAYEIIRADLLGQVMERSLEDQASRASWLAASRIAANLANAISVDTAPGQRLSPSPALMMMMHRLTRGENSVDAMTSPDLRLALPRTSDEESPLSVLDLSQIVEGGRLTYVTNRIARRPNEGRTVIIFPDGVENEEFQSLRDGLGRFYGIEGSAEMSHVVADGTSGISKWSMLSIGDRRPEPLDSVPIAALRVSNIIQPDDLLAFERDLQRSRARIREFNAGENQVAEERGIQGMINDHQVPYVPMSKIGQSTTVIPYPLQGAMMTAHAKIMRHLEESGGVDAAVASALGMSIDQMGDIFLPEQVDAAAAWMYSRDMGKGFALTDGTGVGKSYSNAAILMIHMRDKIARGETARGVYLTESVMNVPDVLEVMMRTGYGGLRIGILTTKMEATVTVDGAEREYRNIPDGKRRTILTSGEFPDEYDVIISTYSMFSGAAYTKDGEMKSPGGYWAHNAFDNSVMVVADEGHNAISENTHRGRNIRAMKDAMPKWQFLSSTATPYRTPKQALFYSHLIPDDVPNAEELLMSLPRGRESAQEGLTTQLTEDGSWMRRTRTLSGLTINSVFPSDADMEFNQVTMNRFSAIAEQMVVASSMSRERSNRIIEERVRQLVTNGATQTAAVQRVKELTTDTDNFGGAVSQLTRMIIVALRCRTIVGNAISDLEAGRKPIISFDQTMMSLFNERVKDGLGVEGLTMRDQITRVLDRIYKFRVGEESFDMRDLDPQIAQGYANIRDMIEEFPELPASPIDDLMDKIRAAGYSIGEVSGRSTTYTNGQMVPREKDERDKAAVIRKFNNGEYDALAHNKSGATGGNFHAHEDFLDQRQRSTWIADVFEEVIKMLQGFGRSDRHKQTSAPIINWQMTGLMGEMRLFQQVNRRLRILGASVDANRNHPMLIESVPDFLNKIGDQAFAEVLSRFPDQATRMGMGYLARKDDNDENDNDEEEANITFEGDNVASRAMSRLIVLRDDEQDEIIRQVKNEFDAIIEDLDSRNANPLKPKMIPGEFTVLAETVYSGVEQDPENPSSSSFNAPIYVRTGFVEYPGANINGDAVMALIERSRRVNGSEGFAPWSEIMDGAIPDLMMRHAAAGVPVREAMANPEGQSATFRNRLETYRKFSELLSQLKPGVMVRANIYGQNNGETSGYIVTDLIRPYSHLEVAIPSSYKVVMISPGDEKEVSISLRQLINDNPAGIHVSDGLSKDDNPGIRARFDLQAGKMVKKEAQVLHGPLLSVIYEAQKKKLGTLSTYVDSKTGAIMRGVVVYTQNTDLTLLPVDIRSPEIMLGIAATVGQQAGIGKVAGGNPPESVTVRGMFEPYDDLYKNEDPDIRIIFSRTRVTFDMVPPRVGNHDFYAERPGLHEAIFDKPLEDKDKVGSKRKGKSRKHPGFATIDYDSPENIERVRTALRLMVERREGMNASIYCTGRARDFINTVGLAVQDIPDAEIIEENEAETALVTDEAENVVAITDAAEIGGAEEGGIEWGGDLSLDEPIADETDAEPTEDEEEEIEWEIRA